MIKLLLKFWPALIPIALFILWYVLAVRRAKKQPDPILPKLRDGPWFITCVSSIGIVILCVFIWGVSDDKQKGRYTPAVLENGQIIDGKVAPQ